MGTSRPRGPPEALGIHAGALGSPRGLWRPPRWPEDLRAPAAPTRAPLSALPHGDENCYRLRTGDRTPSRGVLAVPRPPSSPQDWGGGKGDGDGTLGPSRTRLGASAGPRSSWGPTALGAPQGPLIGIHAGALGSPRGLWRPPRWPEDLRAPAAPAGAPRVAGPQELQGPPEAPWRVREGKGPWAP